jgi:uncharacterized protein (DUF362 family)
MISLTQSAKWALGRLQGSIQYPPVSAAPYGPDQPFPELAAAVPAGTPPNPVFALVRGVLRDLGLDAARFGTPQWNPLGELVRPGGKIVVKPNWVMHANWGPGGMDCMITHPAVLRAVLDYVFLAQPAQVVLGDAPLQGCDFERMMEHGAMRAVIAYFQDRGLPLVVRDFRRTVIKQAGKLKLVGEELRPESDYVLVDLGPDSLLEPISKDWKKFRVTVYDPRKMWAHHRPGRHRFLIAREILEADLVVNVPKLKAHKKAGITCCLKNLIGINGNKEYLPHHRKGGADAGRGGDNYEHRAWLMALMESTLDWMNRHRNWPWLYHQGERVVWHLLHLRRRRDPHAQFEGSWYGNDTIWRTCLDLNRALLYGDCTGGLRDTVQRQEISIVDAVVAGQGEGPLDPTPLETGAVFAARNPAVGDFLGSRLLGFDPDKIPLMRHACEDMRWRICSVPAGEIRAAIEQHLAAQVPFPPALPPRGWAGHVEYRSSGKG